MTTPPGSVPPPETRPPWWRRATLAHVWLVVPWIGIVIAARRPIGDGSFLWHVRAGTVQLQEGSVLRADPFSFTAHGAAWRTQSWVADLLYGWLDARVGLRFVPWLIGTVGILTVVLMATAVYRETCGPRAAGLMMVGLIWLGVAYLVPRPVLFSFLLLAALVVVVGDERLRWTIPLLLWVWASLHGSFVLGLALLALEAMRRRSLSRVGDVAAGVIAASLTAHGIHVWGTLLQFWRSRDALDLIREWAPPDFTAPSLLPFVAVVVLLLVASTQGRLATGDLLVVGPFLAFGLTSERAVFPALLVLAPFAARAWARSRVAVPAAGPALAVGGWVLVAAIAVVPYLVGGGDQEVDATKFPVSAAGALGAGPTFHDEVTGGYLIYAAWPRQQVFVDDRAELYGRELFDQLLTTKAARPGWEEVLAGHAISQVLLGTDDALVGVLQERGWPLRYADEHFVVLTAPQASR